MLIMQTGLLIIIIIMPFLALNVTYAQNLSTPVLQTGSPVYYYPQPPAPYTATTATNVGNFDITSIIGIVGAAIAYLSSKQGDKKAADERDELRKKLEQKDKELKETQQGALMIANVTNKAVQSLKETDYGDQDFARIFYTMINQLSKLDIIKPVLTEKIKTNDTDLLINNKSIVEIATQHLEEMIRDNHQYYNKMQPDLNDTCDNRIIRTISEANKMVTKDSD